MVVVYTRETAFPGHDLHSRVFAPPTFGYLEDPATGSGNAALGNFLIRQNLWKNRTLVIEQGGPDRENPNIVRLLRPEDGGLMFGGGGGRVRIDGGEYVLSTGAPPGQPE